MAPEQTKTGISEHRKIAFQNQHTSTASKKVIMCLVFTFGGPEKKSPAPLALEFITAHFVHRTAPTPDPHQVRHTFLTSVPGAWRRVLV